jgi:hypothetical protein
MLFTIGRRETGEDAVDLLLACHARIRHFLALALRAGDDAEAIAAVRRYFTEALPLHIADEDELLAPRVHVGDMSDEHRAHAALVARLAAGEMAAAVELAPLLLAHLDAEERDVFPLVRALPASERAEILAGMRARRA